MAGLESARMFLDGAFYSKVQDEENYAIVDLPAKATVDTSNPKDRLGDKKVDVSQVSPFAIAHEACAMMDGTLKYWHAENGFVGNLRNAEAYIWNKDEGLVGTAIYCDNAQEPILTKRELVKGYLNGTVKKRTLKLAGNNAAVVKAKK